jgi:AcrR family transcriptional regulator
MRAERATKLPSRATNHETATRIIDAAQRLFARQGFRATSVKEIMVECGITQAALYLYFPSKDALLTELIRVGYDHLRENLDDADLRSGAGAEAGVRLGNLVEGFVRYGTEYRTLARVADNEWKQLGPKEQRTVAAMRRAIRGRFEQVIAIGVADQSFVLPRTSMRGAARQQRFAATAVIDMCSGVFNWYSKDGTVAAADLVAGYRSLALRMVGAGLSTA